MAEQLLEVRSIEQRLELRRGARRTYAQVKRLEPRAPRNQNSGPRTVRPGNEWA